MLKLLLTYWSILFLLTNGLAQELDPQVIKESYREVLLTNILFSVGDTVIPYSLLVGPTGNIGFVEGYDFSYAKIGMTPIQGYAGKGKNKRLLKDTIIPTKEEPDHLTSYFPPLNQDSTKFINGYNFELDWEPHYRYEIYFSYILNGILAPDLYHSDHDSIIRLVVPEEGGNEEIHNIYVIDLQHPNIKIRYVKVKHYYTGNFEILEQGTSLVSNQKEIEEFFNDLSSQKFSSDSYFIKDDGSLQYLVEVKIANEYFAGMRPYLDLKGPVPDHMFPWNVRYLYRTNKKRR